MPSGGTGTSPRPRRPRLVAGDDVSPAWEELAAATGAPPFLWPGWVLAWQRAFRDRPSRVRAVDGAAGLRAVLPVERRPWHAATPVNWHTPLAGVVACDDEARRELLGSLLTDRRPVVLGFLEAGSPDVAAARASAAASGWGVAERSLLEPVHRTFEGGWEQVQPSLSTNLRSDVRRRRRRLEELGALSVEIVEPGTGLDGLLDEAFDLEASGWKGRAGTAIRSRPETERFYREVARWASDRGWLRLAFLRLDGRAVACQYLLDVAGVRYYVKGGFDEHLERASPGKVLMYDVVEDAVRAGLGRFEFLGGREPYKEVWANGGTTLVELRLAPPTVAGALDATVHTRVRPVAVAAVRSARRRVEAGWRS